MTVYLGKKPVGVTKIVKKEVVKTKFGVSIDNMLGNVDAEGNYIKPTDTFVCNLTGVKTLSESAFSQTFIGSPNITQFIANDVVSIGKYGAYYVCSNARWLERFCFDGLEEVYSEGAFRCCANGYIVVPSFKKLRIISGIDIFNNAFYSAYRINCSLDEIFPSLEEIAGNGVLSACLYWSTNPEQHLSKVRKITGSSVSYNCTFGAMYFSGSKWYLPSAVEITGRVWNVGSSYTGELHFAAANQAAIEACEGYDYKWGFAGATIYFDLMLSIMVEGVVYSRKHTIGGYTSWKDTDGNIVYTDATAEPTVGTVVYSDQGTTQVGTVSEVA